MILKEYTQNEDIFCYQDNVHIKIEIPKLFYDFSEKFMILKLFKKTNLEKITKFQLLNESDKNFDDEEDIKKDKELYMNYKKNLTTKKTIRNTLDETMIPEDIQNIRKNHKYLYQSDIQVVCNYLDLFDTNKIILEKKNLIFYSLVQINYELEKNFYHYSKYIDEKRCEELINKYIKIPNCSYHQVYIFIKVFSHQLKLFSNNYALMAETLYAGNIDRMIRVDLLKSILNLTQFFTEGAFNDIVKEQNQISLNYDENTIKNITDILASKEKIVNFENLKNNSLVCIDEDGQSLTILTNISPESKDYQDLEKFYNMGRNFGKFTNKRLHLIDFNTNKLDENNFDETIKEDEKKIPNFKFLKVIQKYLCLKDNIQSMREKIGSYTFTADNFFKMILILLRIKSKIPVILMGETGCGKTSLINSICALSGFKLISITINAGVTDNDIVSFIVKNKLNEEEIEYEKNEDDLIEYTSNLETSNSKEYIHENKENNETIILFFDELNTCNSQGLFTEIICKHTVQGKKIKDNVIFIGACNPYRVKIQEQETTALIKKDYLSSNLNLVYTVYPLTHSELYYVFNFGTLSVDDEKKYVENIAEYELSKIIKNIIIKKKLTDLMVESFIFSQQYIRKKNGKESVSLREIRKFFIIYNFILKDFLRKKNQKPLSEEEDDDEIKMKIDYEFYKNKNEEMIHKYSISVGLYICFYIRLMKEDEKQNFEEGITKILKIPFTEYPILLQNELIDNIKIEKGIAANKTLKLNLFITFIGIITRIAVFLVGPPGCSKTLSINLLKNFMKGINSNSKFWKQYPQLFVTSFQGSLTATSSAIKKTFIKAENHIKNWLKNKKIKENEEIDGNDIISLVFIDEIGLCEISPLNPLKVIHSFLELDYKNKKDIEKIAFVGISNWKLDASKMNRGIFLNVFSPESNENDMFDTANEIVKIYDSLFVDKEENKKLIKDISQAVYKYKIYLNQSLNNNKYFHGSRDFYNLIK